MTPARSGDPHPAHILVLFLDGVGIGPANPEVNPFLQARIPHLRELLDGRPPSLDTLENPSPSARARLLALDACLGIEGLPQSGTGQIALLTGHNAPRLLGRHFGPWPPVRLRTLLSEENLLVRARDLGSSVTFANAYPAGYPEGRNRRLVAAPPLAAQAAGRLNLDHRALARGRAVASEIVNSGWRTHLGFRDLPEVTPREAGRNLARIASEARLTLFAHYLTDLAGHRGGAAGAREALHRVDAFLGGILEILDDDTLLLLTSDHGNLEDLRGGHTRNPALGMALGPGAGTFPLSLPLTGVTPSLLRLLGHQGGDP